MNPAMTNLALSLGAMQLGKRLPLDDPKWIMGLRIAYVSAQLFVMALYYYITMVIRKKNDLTVIKYVSPPSAMNPDAKPEAVTTTTRDYDLAEVGKAMKGMFFGIAMMGFLHGYMKYSQPLLLQSVMAVKGAFEQNEVQLHLFGKPATGNLARPFKSAPGLLDSLTGQNSAPQTDAASIKSAEKAGAKKSQ